MNYLESNLAKAEELDENVRWAFVKWCTECAELNLIMRVAECYRSQARQNELYAQGRTKAGKIVTWTKTSFHTKRLAADIIPVNCSFIQIEAVANKYGIYRPQDTLKLGDYGHFQMDKVTMNPDIPPRSVSAEARIKGLLRRLAVTSLQSTRDMIQRMIERLERRKT